MTRQKSIALLATLALASALAACSSNEPAGPAQRAGQKVDQGLHKLGEKDVAPEYKKTRPEASQPRVRLETAFKF